MLKKLLKKKEHSAFRFPRLDTILMVEETIKKYDGEFTKKNLWSKLPKQVMYQTFCVIIDYLLYSRKISIDLNGKLGWVFYPESVKERLRKKELFWSN
ncbi:hypothetical protein COV11_01065 [Candidatus Woesearchaeota archaeon CG10_big_fil_rev_8_21_14_0_10_30_7]|nr:MAG: hypothetical protein COV11_01065 [Candidatus Woesearchaeota archaeon CG10_big_fil_rev_8_21_14_0_10_30_7]